jgi:hypothetical protein
MNLRHATAQASANTEPTETRRARGEKMSRSIITLLAWFTWILYLALALLRLLLQFVNDPSSFLGNVFGALVLLTFATVGALVASHHPKNPIGWIFCIGTLLSAFGDFALEYAVYTFIRHPGSLPGGEWMAWFGDWFRGLGWFMIVTFLLLLFPTGRLPSRRWRPVAWLAFGALTLFTVTVALAPYSLDYRLSFLRNPTGIEIPRVIFDPLTAVTLLLLGVSVVACAASVISRFRYATGEQRQQLKWFAFAAVLGTIGVGVILVGIFLSINFGSVPFYLVIVGFPIATGIAILKYRLYDIDLIINRTLVYGTLTATLAAVYYGLVIGLQSLLHVITGQVSQSPLAIVVSTLAIYILFQPLRHRIQRIIDRRFYRSKYDAARIIANFSATLRGEIDLNQLSEHLIAVVQETMQPAHVSLWLRAPERPENYRNKTDTTE